MFSKEAAGSTCPLKHNGWVRHHKYRVPCVPARSQVCEMSAVLLASGRAGYELTAGEHEGDRREKASALNDPRECLVKMQPEVGQTLAKHAQIRVQGRVPGVLQGWRNNLDIQVQKQKQAAFSQDTFP